jgi:hypothetical protein
MPMAMSRLIDDGANDSDRPGPDEALARAARMVRGEYLEMPGLSLTLRQAMRLWHLDAVSCRRVLDELVGSGFLTSTRQGAYRRLEG